MLYMLHLLIFHRFKFPLIILFFHFILVTYKSFAYFLQILVGHQPIILHINHQDFIIDLLTIIQDNIIHLY